MQELTLSQACDVVTLHEIFCREDYRCPSPPGVVVDLGSNVGISALYFLTRAQSTYCELYEPDPRNIPILLCNLKDFENRFTLHEVAVADRQGRLPFATEETGRYGSLVETRPKSAIEENKSDVINVNVEHINVVLDRAIARHGKVDLLKIDTEGCELGTVRAIDPTLLPHVRRIVIEWFDKNVELDSFRVTSSCDTVTFENYLFKEH
jgi:FkbM family methyltransferase